MSNTKPLAERIFLHLYRNEDDTEIEFTESQLQVKKIYEDVFAKWLENPELEDIHIVNYLMNECGRSRRHAYRDITAIKSVLGNVRNATKEWQRYTVIKMLKDAYNLAKNKGQYKEMIMAADKLGKYTKLDQDEMDDIPWDEIIPPAWEPSADPALLNIPGTPDDIGALKEKLRKKYLSVVKIEDAEVIDDGG